MNCEHYQTLFFDYERNTLAVKTGEELNAHLQSCEHCAAMLTDLRQVHQLLDRQHAPSPQAETRFKERLLLEARVASQSRAAKTSAPSLLGLLQQWWHKYWPSQPLGAFSYSAALLLLGLVGGQYLPPRSFGFGADPGQLAELGLSRERLIQLCAVPPQPAVNLL